MEKKSGKPYVCSVCEKGFTFPCYLRKHERIHTSVKPYKCPICNKAFLSPDLLKTHDRGVHQKLRPYKCSLCKKAFYTSSLLKIHEYIHQGVKPYNCSVCKKGFALPSYLRQHERIHTGVKPHKCHICNKAFLNPHHLKTHDRIVHQKVRPYKCSLCKKAFYTSGHLKIHEYIHQGVKPYSCSVCKKDFSQTSSLRTHERIHQGVKPYKCSVCKKEFYSSGNFKVHKRIHQGVKPYKCSVCNKHFSQSSSLKTHERIHQEKEISRSKSHKTHERIHQEKEFSRSNSHKTHERIHRGVKSYKCSVCEIEFSRFCSLRTHERVLMHYKGLVYEKNFSQSSSLKTHEKIHQNAKRYKCPVCKKEFSLSRNLKIHERIHLSVQLYKCSSSRKKDYRVHRVVKPYKCSVCKRAFPLYSNLKKHEIIIHQGVRPYKCSVCKKAFHTCRNIQGHGKIHGCLMHFHGSVICKQEMSFNSTTKHSTIHCKKGKHHGNSHEEIRLRSKSRSYVHNSSSASKFDTKTQRGIKTQECVLCQEKFTTKYFLTRHTRTYHGNSKLNSSCKDSEIVVHKKPDSICIKICQREDMRLRNEKLTNNISNFAKEESGFVRNFELQENNILQEKQLNEQIPSLEPMENETDAFVSKTDYAELQADYSEFSEEISIEKKEILVETEYAKELDTGCSSMFDNFCEEEYCREGSDNSDDNNCVELIISKKGDTTITKAGERPVSELVKEEVMELASTNPANKEKDYHGNCSDIEDFNNDYCLRSINQISDNELCQKGDIYGTSLERIDDSRVTILSSGKPTEISIACQTESVQLSKSKGVPTERVEVIHYRHLNSDTVEEYNSDQAGTSDSFQENISCDAIFKPNSSITIKDGHSSELYKPKYNSIAKPFRKCVYEMLTRPNSTNKKLDISNASLYEFRVIDDWMKD